MTVYFISGLGADRRAFQKLYLPTTWKVVHIEWPEISNNESLSSYARKISALIDSSEKFAIVGLSFGGIIATELTKWFSPSITVLLSSVSTRNELPGLFKLLGWTRIIKIIPSFLLNRVYPFTNWYFGVTQPDEKLLLKQIIHDTPPLFLKWAINEILLWKNTKRPENIYHIHGIADKIFPCKKTLADIKIEGGHFIVLNEAQAISKILAEKIGSK